MNIKSNKEGVKSSWNFNKLKQNLNTPYTSTTLIGVGLFILSFLLPISWGIGILLMLLIGVITTITLNVKLGYYNNLEWSKYLAIMGFFILISSPITWIPMVSEYNTAERIDETLPLGEEVKVYYNDEHYSFILFVDGMKNPLMIDKDQSDTYNTIKANYLDGKAKVEKKRVKAWYDDEVTVGYYLDGNRFY